MKQNKFWNAVGHILGIAISLAAILGVAALIKLSILYLIG